MTDDVTVSGDSWSFRDAARRDLRAAMKSRQADTVSALRTMIAAIDNAEAVRPDPDAHSPVHGVVAYSASGVGSTEAPRRELTPGDVQAIVRDLIREYETEARRYRTSGQHDAADRLRHKAVVLRGYL